MKKIWIETTVILLQMHAFARAFQSSLEKLADTRTSSSFPIYFAKRKGFEGNIKRIGEFWEARMDGFRPTINDVERISWGKPAKQKGTGSRGIPHRLNEEERLLFDQARRKGFLEIAGSGWRSQRRDAPLLNTYRSLCDARGQASIVLHKDRSGIDELVVDISPLRVQHDFPQIANECLRRQPDGTVVFDYSEGDDEEKNDGQVDSAALNDEDSPWARRPIYQLPPFCLVWNLPRSEAKAVGKKMAETFQTMEAKSGKSKKPIGVKPGKGRRHGGYGIG